LAERLVVYTVLHQPRRLRLPAQPVARGESRERLADHLFDEAMNRRYFEKVSETCYTPATAMFRRLTRAGWKMAIGFSNSFLLQAEAWRPALLEDLRRLCSSANVEVVCVEPYHSWLCYLDIRAFQERMRWARTRLEALFQKPVTVTDTTEMFMSNDVYFALQACGFRAALMEGRRWQLGERDPTYLYRHPGQAMSLLCRHHDLSDDVGYRFTDQAWESWPLRPQAYADWIRRAWGDLVVVGWDYETFGEHHRRDSGILKFVPRLNSALKRMGVRMLLPSEALEELGDSRQEIAVSEYGTTWAGEGGMEFFLGNEAQQVLFRLMNHAYSKALLTGDPGLVETACWLAQSDNLHLIQCFGRSGDEAQVSSYFTPDEWWQLGDAGIVREQQRVYVNFIRACDEYVADSALPKAGNDC
jgi:alpha-amylase